MLPPPPHAQKWTQAFLPQLLRAQLAGSAMGHRRCVYPLQWGSQSIESCIIVVLLQIWIVKVASFFWSLLNIRRVCKWAKQSFFFLIYKAVNVKWGQQTYICSGGEVVLSVLEHCSPEFTPVERVRLSSFLASLLTVSLELSWPCCICIHAVF